MIPVQSKIFPRVLEEPNTLFYCSTLAGIIFNSLVWLAEQNKCMDVFPLLMRSCQDVEALGVLIYGMI